MKFKGDDKEANKKFWMKTCTPHGYRDQKFCKVITAMHILQSIWVENRYSAKPSPSNTVLNSHFIALKFTDSSHSHSNAKEGI